MGNRIVFSDTKLNTILYLIIVMNTIDRNMANCMRSRRKNWQIEENLVLNLVHVDKIHLKADTYRQIYFKIWQVVKFAIQNLVLSEKK